MLFTHNTYGHVVIVYRRFIEECSSGQVRNWPADAPPPPTPNWKKMVLKERTRCVCVCGWKWHLQIVISSSGKEKYRVEESAGGVLTKYGHERQQPSSDPIQQLRNVGSIHPHTALLAMAYFKTPTGASITHKKKKKKLRRWWWFFVLLEIRISSDRGRDKESVRTCVHHALWKTKWRPVDIISTHWHQARQELLGKLQFFLMEPVWCQMNTIRKHMCVWRIPIAFFW
jgi:hypothetical protein